MEGIQDTFDIFRVRIYLNSVLGVDDTEESSEKALASIWETLRSTLSTTKINK